MRLLSSRYSEGQIKETKHIHQRNQNCDDFVCAFFFIRQYDGEIIHLPDYWLLTNYITYTEP